MKLAQNVFLDEILDYFENWSCRDENQVIKSNFKEKKCAHSKGHNFCSILLKFGQNACYDDLLDKFENASYQIKC